MYPCCTSTDREGFDRHPGLHPVDQPAELVMVVPVSTSTSWVASGLFHISLPMTTAPSYSFGSCGDTPRRNTVVTGRHSRPVSVGVSRRSTTSM